MQPDNLDTESCIQCGRVYQHSKPEYVFRSDLSLAGTTHMSCVSKWRASFGLPWYYAVRMRMRSVETARRTCWVNSSHERATIDTMTWLLFVEDQDEHLALLEAWRGLDSYSLP